MSEDQLRHIKMAAQKYFNVAKGSHDWEHTLRVARLANVIGNALNADLVVLEAACYLHDIGRTRQDQSKGALCHAKESARLAAPLIENLRLEKHRRENILHCIESHRFRSRPAPSTLEAKVLFDADKLDGIGAVGIARAYLFAGELNACLHNPNLAPEDAEPYSRDDTGYREYVVKLSKVKDRMLTDKGREIANERHAFMDLFFNRFLEEYDGKR